MKTPKMDDQEIFKLAHADMHANNPEHSTSHDIEDWVVENFMDRIKVIGYKGNTDDAAAWWFNNK